MKTIITDRRKENAEKGETEMKTLVEKKQIKPTETEKVAEQSREVTAPKIEMADSASIKPEKTSAPEEVSPSKGLCVTCNEEPHCAYAKSATRPILYCEMFDEGQTEEPVQVEKSPDPPRAAERENPVSRLKGLCANCDLRDTCTFPKPEGGVWHCEEYS